MEYLPGRSSFNPKARKALRNETLKIRDGLLEGKWARVNRIHRENARVGNNKHTGNAPD